MKDQGTQLVDMPPGKRERHKRQTRTAIQTAAIDLYEQRGYEDTTIADIVHRAGVSQRTFFRYFPTKEHTLFADDRAYRIDSFIETAPDDLDPLEALHWVIRQALAVETSGLDRRRQAIRQSVRESSAVEHYLSLRYEQLLVEMRSAFRRRLGIDAHDTLDLRAEVLVAIYHGAIRALDPVDDTIEAVVDHWFAAARELLDPARRLRPQ